MENKETRQVLTEPRMSTYLHAKGAALGLPISGTFELTARCNFNCRMCYVHQNNPENIAKELTAAEWIELGKKARDMGMIFLLLTGGEPMLRPDFVEIYTELVKLGFFMTINSNASLYNEEIRQAFLKYPPAKINVTLYGGSDETYQNMCGNASFEKVKSNLRSMIEDKIPVRLNVSLTPHNVADMEKIDAAAKELGLFARATTYMYPQTRLTDEVGGNNGRFTAEDAGKFMAEWDKVHYPEEIFLKRAELICQNCKVTEDEECEELTSSVTGIRCRAGKSYLWLTWDGRMMPCGTMPIEDDAPDVRKNGFEASWKWIRDYAAAIQNPVECVQCPDKSNCPPCAASCKCETGKFNEVPRYLCQWIQSQKKRYQEMADTIRKENENETQI